MSSATPRSRTPSRTPTCAGDESTLKLVPEPSSLNVSSSDLVPFLAPPLASSSSSSASPLVEHLPEPRSLSLMVARSTRPLMYSSILCQGADSTFSRMTSFGPLAPSLNMFSTMPRKVVPEVPSSSMPPT